jgi:predicted lysophospholipase L1 biosynthesis ABC-type transport system permease subunit
LPEKAPNHFVLNVLPEQSAEFTTYLQQVRAVLAQVTLALELLLVFVLAAGFAVTFA